MDVNSDSLLPDFETASGKKKVRVEDNGPSKLSLLRVNSTAENNDGVLLADTNPIIIPTDLPISTSVAVHPRERSYFHMSLPEFLSESDDDTRDASGPSSTETDKFGSKILKNNNAIPEAVILPKAPRVADVKFGSKISKNYNAVPEAVISPKAPREADMKPFTSPVVDRKETDFTFLVESESVADLVSPPTPTISTRSFDRSALKKDQMAAPLFSFGANAASQVVCASAVSTSTATEGSASSSGLTSSFPPFPESRSTGKSVFGLSAFSQPSTSSSSFADISSKSSISANPSLPGGTSNLALHNSLADHFFQFFPRHGAATPAVEISVNVYLQGLTFSVTADTIGSLKTGIMNRLSWTDLDLNRRILVPDNRNFNISPIPILFEGRNLLESEDGSSLYCLGLHNREQLVLGLKSSFIISLLIPTRYISRPFDIKEISVKPYDTVDKLKRKIAMEMGEPVTKDNLLTNFFGEGIDNMPILSLGFYPINYDKNKRSRLFSIEWMTRQHYELGLLPNS